MPPPSRFKWHPPLNRFMGEVSELELTRPAPLRELLARFRDTEPRLEPFFRFGADDTLPKGLMILRGAQRLILTDLVDPGDEVEILLAVQGG